MKRPARTQGCECRKNIGTRAATSAATPGSATNAASLQIEISFRVFRTYSSGAGRTLDMSRSDGLYSSSSLERCKRF